MLTWTLAEHVLRRDLGGAWDVLVNGGSLGNTRVAVSGDTSVVLKLGQPAAALRRLASWVSRRRSWPGASALHQEIRRRAALRRQTVRDFILNLLERELARPTWDESGLQR